MLAMDTNNDQNSDGKVASTTGNVRSTSPTAREIVPFSPTARRAGISFSIAESGSDSCIPVEAGAGVDIKYIIVKVGDGKLITLPECHARMLPPIMEALDDAPYTDPLALPISHEQLGWIMRVLVTSDENVWDYVDHKVLLERLRCIDSLFDQDATVRYVRSLLDDVPDELWGCRDVCTEPEQVAKAKVYRDSVYTALGGKKGRAIVSEIYPNDVLVMEDRYAQKDRGVSTAWLLEYRAAAPAMIHEIPMRFATLSRQSSMSSNSSNSTPNTSPFASPRKGG